MLHLRSDGPVHVASMSLLAPLRADGRETFPTMANWRQLLLNGRLLSPRDRAPSPLNSKSYRFFYGRVAGVSRGSTWQAQVTDSAKSKKLTIPERGQAFSYGLSTLPRGTFGTGQIQSAPMLVRYPDTAYLSHGNYGVHYQLALPLHNPTSDPQTVIISMDTPLNRIEYRAADSAFCVKHRKSRFSSEERYERVTPMIMEFHRLAMFHWFNIEVSKAMHWLP